MAFTFVHAADLHLDSPFEGLTAEAADAPEVARVARGATFEALERIERICVEEGAEFLLLAGDVYDQDYQSASAQLRLHDVLCRLEARAVRSFVIHGNHDPAADKTNSVTWPEAVAVFGCEEVETRAFQTKAGDPVTVSGISYRSAAEKRRLHTHFQCPGQDGFHIALLHCSLASHRARQPYCECRLQDLVERGFDYWALGHVHNRAVLAEFPHVVYPGNSQGRSIRETGERGCMVVRVDPTKGTVDTEFRATHAVRWEVAEVSADGIESLNDLETSLMSRCEGLQNATESRGVVCRVRLVGRTPLFHDLSAPEARDGLLERARQQWASQTPFVWVESLDSRLRPPVDLACRAEEKDLIGEVLRYAASLETDPEALESTLRGACSDVLDHVRMSRILDAPSPDEWKDILDRARLLAFDQLETH